MLSKIVNYSDTGWAMGYRYGFDYVEMFYNVKHRHGYAGQRSPAQFKPLYLNQCDTV